MTRKHYVAIAAALRDTLLINCPTKSYLEGARAAHVSAANRIADVLAKGNPRFNRDRFLTAAGVAS